MSDDDVIRYDMRSAEPRWLRLANAGSLFVLAALLVVWFALGAPWDRLLVGVPFVAWAVVGAVMRLRPVVVDPRGFHVPLRRSVSWTDVASVKPPGPFLECVMLTMADGAQRRTPLPPEYAEQVARIGGVPLE